MSDGTPDIVRPWQEIGGPPTAGRKGPACPECGESMYVELGGGNAPGVNRPNLDCQAGPTVDLVIDLARTALPFHDNHAQWIRMLHLLNHLSAHDGERLLRECWRILRPGWSLYIMVTDLEFLCQRILADGPHSSWVAGLHGAEGDCSDADFHRWNYTPDSLTALLYAVGFSFVQNCGHANAWEMKVMAFK